MKRLLGIIAIIALGIAFIVNCAPKSSFVYDDAQPISWRVGLSFPSSSLEIIDRSTVGRWSTIVDEIKSDLIAHGFSENNIIIRQTDKRTTQIAQVDELVHQEKVDELVVVPVDFTREELVALNGDPTQAYKLAQYEKLKLKAEQTGNPALLQGVKEPPALKELSASTLEQQQKIRDEINARSLEQSLTDAKRAGTYIVGVGANNLNNFPFDYFVSTPAPEDIANVQAGFAVAHLGLPELEEDGTAPPLETPSSAKDAAPASSPSNNPTTPENVPDNAPQNPPSETSVGDQSGSQSQTSAQTPAQASIWPKNIEVMALDAVRPESNRYFSQLLKRMKPYFDAGYLHSNSGLVSIESTNQDYIGVSITEDGDKSAGIMHDILNKYYKENDSAHRLSFIFAQSDALSRGAVRALVESSLQPTDIRWPEVTGYGAEKISVSDIVEGKQAMSIAYDSKAMAVAISQMLNNHALKLDPLSKTNFSGNDAITEAATGGVDDATRNEDAVTIYFDTAQAEGGVQIPQITMRTITIEAENLKEFLVEKGYVTPADAGL
jgi:ABC-type xylose transport system substrate-binding protein